ncbi:MAG: ferritin family protein [Deltaproteobacteria bacterium]|jgi:rubrerythrin|nr:ferritin family protein [Deltaproteobacteria bacterium]
MIYPFNAVEAVKIAISIEENGLKFYNEAAKRFAPSKVSDLFARLAKEEVVHETLFKKLLETLPDKDKPTVYDPDNEMDQYLRMMAGLHIFRQSPDAEDKFLESVKDEKSALELAMSFEKDSIALFVQLKHSASEFGDRVPIDKLIGEEAKHLRTLASEYNKLFG